ncbi:hypothetical protein K491DRAFT_652732 [Lophiostoma macrostomum CBS 122681]|uniref:Uncharacterized protein n=1 Tax=Lophiostoma macrostomum CBS 122681 TaxID=1314788 RepID=A0A6A6TGD8_9PLEO|nr:hypothetical protein K491DRAFT_652732 [Lophiostoma macrostomum CBS 122681]
MPPAKDTPKGKKRTSDGRPKPQTTTSQQAAQQTPTCAQPPKSPRTSSLEPEPTPTTSEPTPGVSNSTEQPQQPRATKAGQAPHKTANPTQNPKPKSTKKHKLPRLPPYTTLTKRPLLHPAIPSPYTSASAPKCVYITTTSPFVPAVKRVRFLLSEIEKRGAQSEISTIAAGALGKGKGKMGTGGAKIGMQANGRLHARTVERAIASGRVDAVNGTSTATSTVNAPGKSTSTSPPRPPRAEPVFLKAAGKAIQRALELGVYFQKVGDCRVRVEFGSVSAVDDVDVDQRHTAKKDKGKILNEDDIPETRIRMLSAVTVAIRLL